MSIYKPTHNQQHHQQQQQQKRKNEIDRLLITASPLITTIDRILSLIIWTNKINSSILLLCLLNLELVQIWIVLLAYSFLASFWNHRRLNQDQLVHQTLHHCLHLSSITIHLQEYLTHLSRTLNFLFIHHPSFFLLSGSLFLWISANSSGSFTLLVVFTWASPPVKWTRNLLYTRFIDDKTLSKELRYGYQENNNGSWWRRKRRSTSTDTLILDQSPPPISKLTPETKHQDPLPVLLKITIIEHQRWTQDKGWSTELTEEDKRIVGGIWTDEYGGLVCGPTQFELPSTLSSFESSASGYGSDHCGIGSWKWSDDDDQWKIVRNSHHLHNNINTNDSNTLTQDSQDWSVDGDGWSYADRNWHGAGCKSRFGSYTRTRKWVRIASFSLNP
ncbi:hypothetical protein MJO28_003014 [Puccinia striiformis f. sp. tritici]|uniref:Uncharacterized protein n=1 Tax=Puccinia striiformis f. sp. tritici TaxID=168172 RepID=A0ACC0ET19_9BASI|nr:hypothetical protein Pst134EB_006114 [Puccinia striiformis f. sp. tritici]KAI7959223.1 hypothetical protein MJO28_003014 [Puccinia striiformis f. sp. tritici]